jgi:hypothetical protein
MTITFICGSAAQLVGSRPVLRNPGGVEEGLALVLTGQAKPSYALALRFMLGEEGDGV